MKLYKNYLTNQARRRQDPDIRQIKNGSVTTRWGSKTAQPFLSQPVPAPEAEPTFQLPESVTIVDSTKI